MLHNVIFSVAFISVSIYLMVFFRFTRRVPRLHPELWQSLGCPEPFGLRGQSTYLAVVLGLEKRAPIQAMPAVRSEVLVIRASLAITVAAFVVAAVLTG
ncbi:TPA: hypothetical protein UMY79_001478 [Stenotrophomonas maltophilia]|uniref:Integral membrane protein n=1 Tax=Stenotrophomonas forensis TaxID=2871169 RepID=A0ABY7Y4E1_9GAMM|nr:MULTISPECIES: hypothetical protein [Stenotrophomonas]WDM64842.1 hypothetical protein K5L94_06015 [Stenotrophomonas sp. DFS-20110405]HEL3814610.1 hypothetical protein [Stenotrophomonas maltophilia]